MKGTILMLFTLILVIMHCGDAGFQSGSRSYYSKSSQKSTRSNLSVQQGANVIDDSKINTGNQTKKTAARASSLSAWGIIAIVIAAILLITSGYYAFVFYPFLCKKERKYDMMELTNAV